MSDKKGKVIGVFENVILLTSSHYAVLNEH